MKKLIVCLCAMLMLPAMAVAEPPPGNVYPTAPFSANPHLFASTPCGRTLSCSAEDSAVVAAADTCSNTRLGFQPGIMLAFMHKGPYKNCIIPKTYAPQGPGLGAKAQWPVCCLEPTSALSDTCNLTCHFYITNEVGG